ncbi:hypothetical protein CHS0354_018200 [Potamilus streckersoni]|uniref:EF-hand domain-containing protein n=1 Tax=Potamilus streckersoni TaxID=2493646 RepID=A0AAE0VJ51_9BIVA|nr:hypothetical protein CHS0354_018200 [Potamilus streckersoni]
MELRFSLSVSFLIASTFTIIFTGVSGVPLKDGSGLSKTLVGAIHAVSKQLTDSMSDICKTWCFKTCIVQGKLLKDCRVNNQRICEGERIASPDNKHQIAPMSTNFTKYDQTGDGVISPMEFSAAAEVPLQDANTVFTFTDKNGDGFLSLQEFLMAPIVFTDQMAAEMNAYNGFGSMYHVVVETETNATETTSTKSSRQTEASLYKF